MFLLHRQRAGEGQPGEDSFPVSWALHLATIEFWRLRPARSSPGRPCNRVSVQGLRKWKRKLLRRVWLFWDPMDSNLGPWNSPGKDTGVDSHSLPSLGDLPDPGIKPGSPTVQADLSLSEPLKTPALVPAKRSTLGEKQTQSHNKDQLCNTGNSTQYSVTPCTGKESKREWIYVHV